jgi:hypothetical protein
VRIEEQKAVRIQPIKDGRTLFRPGRKVKVFSSAGIAINRRFSSHTRLSQARVSNT